MTTQPTATPLPTTQLPAPQLTLRQLDVRLAARPAPRLVDALGERYFTAGHLPGAINLPHTVDDATLVAALPDRAAEVIAYCANPACQNSHVLAHRLRMLGYANVAVFPGGTKAWTEAGRALVATEPAEAAGA